MLHITLLMEKRLLNFIIWNPNLQKVKQHLFQLKQLKCKKGKDTHTRVWTPLAATEKKWNLNLINQTCHHKNVTWILGFNAWICFCELRGSPLAPQVQIGRVIIRRLTCEWSMVYKCSWQLLPHALCGGCQEHFKAQLSPISTIASSNMQKHTP